MPSENITNNILHKISFTFFMIPEKSVNLAKLVDGRFKIWYNLSQPIKKSFYGLTTRAFLIIIFRHGMMRCCYVH